MQSLQEIAKTLRRLNDLEAKPPAGWVKVLSPSERRLAVRLCREVLPTSLLKHHDHLIAKGRRSLAGVVRGVCGGCHLRLPTGHQRRRAAAGSLDVCDYCGVFLEWLPEPAAPAGEGGNGIAPHPAKRKLPRGRPEE